MTDERHDESAGRGVIEQTFYDVPEKVGRSFGKRLDKPPESGYNGVKRQEAFTAVNGFLPEIGGKVGRCQFQFPELTGMPLPSGFARFFRSGTDRLFDPESR